MQARELLIEMLLMHASVPDAYAEARRMARPLPGAPAMKIVVDFDGGIVSLPDAECVARQLAGKPDRTRQDIVDALAACTAGT